MDASANNELASMKRELNSIISELEDIACGIQRDFTGVGEDRCAGAINRVITQYKSVKRSLDRLDTKTVTSSFAKWR